MGIQPNPYASPSPGGFAPCPPYVSPVVRDPHWWVAPLVFTPLAALLAYVDFMTSGLSSGGGWALGYLVPLVVAASTSLTERTMRRRPLRLTLGVMACAFAVFYSKLLVLVGIGAFVVALFTGDVGA